MLRSICCFLFLGIALSVIGVQAKDLPRPPSEARIAMGLSKPPYIDQEFESGLECDIIRESLKAVGILFKPNFVSLNRGEILFKTNQVDGVINKHTGLLQGFPSDPYIEYHNTAASLSSRNISIQKTSDLQGYSVSAFQTAKSLLGPDFKAMAEKNPRYFEVADQQAQVEQLLRKRADVIIGDVLIFKYYQRKLKNTYHLDDEMVLHDLFPASSYVIMFQTEELRDAFNKGLAIIRKNKTYAGLISKYTQTPNSPMKPKSLKKKN